MTAHRTPPVRRRPLAALLVALTTALTGVVATGAQAGPPVAPTPVQIIVADVRGVVAPKTLGAPEDLLVAGTPFQVDVSLSAPISETKPVTLRIAATGGPGFTASSVTQIEVPKGAVRGSFTALALDRAANDVQLVVSATAPAKDVASVLAGRSGKLDVARDAVSYGIAGPSGASVSREGPGVACTATPERPTCVDLILPADDGNGTQVVFSTQVCRDDDGCVLSRDVLQVLAVFELDRTTPATLVVKCDKTLCGGGAITSVPFEVSLSATGPLEAPRPCTSKGVIDAGLDSCLDQVQSKRDGAGDTHLFWLVRRDARMII